jgi:hypothetical protein
MGRGQQDGLLSKVQEREQRKDKCREFAKRGRKFMKANHTWDIVAGKVEDVYSRVLEVR